MFGRTYVCCVFFLSLSLLDSQWCQWELVSNGSDEFFIQSARTGARAYATPIMVGLNLRFSVECLP